MKNILEIGCGQGFSAYCLSRNNRVVGIDLSEKNIKTAKSRYPEIDFQVMSADQMNFKNGSFDEVYAMDVLEHVDDLVSVLNEIRRVLRKNGKFVINVPAEKSEEWLLRLRPTYFEEIHHVRIFRANKLEEMLSNQGFALITKNKVGFLQHIELYFLFKRKSGYRGQLGIGHWRDDVFSQILHAAMIMFDPIVLKTPLKYFPLYLITLPIGFLVNLFGNQFFPKSLYYEFKKI